MLKLQAGQHLAQVRTPRSIARDLELKEPKPPDVFFTEWWGGGEPLKRDASSTRRHPPQDPGFSHLTSVLQEIPTISTTLQRITRFKVAMKIKINQTLQRWRVEMNPHVNDVPATIPSQLLVRSLDLDIGLLQNRWIQRVPS